MTAFQNNVGIEEIRNQTEDISGIAEQFHKLYYESIDSKRHLMARLYMETAMLVWNGNPYQNMSEIQKFYEQLPTTTHSVHCVDSQLLSSHAVGAQKTLLIQTAGKSRLHEGSDKSYNPFQQSFIVTAQGDKWKIVTDIYRQQMPLESLGLSQQDQLKQLQFQQQQMQQLQQLQQQQPIPPQEFQQQQQFYPSQNPQFAEQPQLFQQQQLEQQQQQQQLLQQQQLQQQQMQLQQQQQQFQQQQNPQFLPTSFKF